MQTTALITMERNCKRLEPNFQKFTFIKGKELTEPMFTASNKKNILFEWIDWRILNYVTHCSDHYKRRLPQMSETNSLEKTVLFFPNLL